MRDSLRAPAPDAQESVWIEIIRQMESLYAQLAEAQAEIEDHARELAGAKELSDNIIRSMGDSLVVLDAAGNISLVNQSTRRLFGYAEGELIGKPFEVLLPEGSREPWQWRNLRTRIQVHGDLSEAEVTCRDGGGHSIPVGISGAALRDRWGDLIGAVLVVRDLRETKRRIAEVRAAMQAARAQAAELEQAYSELRQLQAELVQAAKMSSLGRLAAGVAHELNNPLGSILLYSDLVLEDTPEGDPRRSNLGKISHQATRCRQIVQGLLDFGRPVESTRGPVDVNGVLREAMSILEGQEMCHNVDVRWQLSPELPAIEGDASRLQQAFTNICLNALEAMEGRGALTIESEPGREPGTVVARVTDTGCGIARVDLDRLFEPFFTRKDDGTGLGLAITYGIIEHHRGEIDVESEPGQGTTFAITLRSMKENGGNE
jgi:PAS domain S-box-containing protein